MRCNSKTPDRTAKRGLKIDTMGNMCNASINTSTAVVIYNVNIHGPLVIGFLA